MNEAELAKLEEIDRRLANIEAALPIVHFVAYGNYTAPCGWPSSRADMHSDDQTSTSWFSVLAVAPYDRMPIVTCPGCVEHGRRVKILPWPEMPDLQDPAAVEAWLD